MRAHKVVEFSLGIPERGCPDEILAVWLPKKPATTGTNPTKTRRSETKAG